jgi:hypothetical protein
VAQKTKPGLMVKSFDKKSDPVSFTLNKDNKKKNVRKNHDLSIHFQKKTKLKSGTEYMLKYRVRGVYLGIENDSMLIQSPQVYIHDEYKRNTDSIYDYFKNTSTGISKMPLSSINKIYYERSQLKCVTAGITAAALVTAFGVAPLAALEKGTLNLDKFRKINRPALGVMVTSITVGIVFSQKRFLIRTDKTGKKNWTINRAG